MSYKTGFHEGRLGIGLSSTMGMGDGNPRYPLDINGDIRLTGSIVNGDGQVLSLTPAAMNWTIDDDDIFFTTGGNVGIGTTSPGAKLEISTAVGTTPFLRLLPNDTTTTPSGLTSIFLGTSTNTNYGISLSSWRKESNGSPYFAINTHENSSSGETRFLVDKNGNVGIGTSSPKYPLHIKKSSAGGYYMVLGHTEFGANTTRLIGFGHIPINSSYYPPAYMGYKSYNGTSGSTQGHLIFGTRNTTSGTTEASERMRITDAGNVGIGTTSPDRLLHIQHSNTGYASNTDSNLVIERNDNNNNWLQFLTKDGEEAGLLFGSSTSTAHGVVSYRNTDGMRFRTGGNNTRMVIDETGNVGIGTTDPGIHTLRVMGTTSSPMYGQILKVSSNASCWLELEANAGGSVEQWGINCSSGAGDLHFYKRTGTDSSGYRLTIKGNGNVGIGTTSPGAKLHVKSSTAPQLLLDDDSHVTGGGGQIYFGNSSHGVGRKTGITNFTAGNDVVLYTAGDGGAGIKTDGGFLKVGSNGNVGIGIAAPNAKFEVNGKIGCGGWSSDGNNSAFCIGSDTNWGMKFLHSGSQYYTTFGCYGTGDNNRGFQFYDHGYSSVRMFINGAGNVGIGTTSPGFPLEVNNSITGPYIGQVGYTHRTGHTTTSGANNDPIGIKTSGVVWTTQYLLASSDRRIKENIVDVSDNQALEIVRNIPCRYYEYKDKLSRGTKKTIGFIAQEVREQFPVAVGLELNIVPNEMRDLTDISWNDTTLYTDISDCSGIKYRFYVSNDPSGNDEILKEVIGNNDNSFTFDSSYNNVFCYGKEVDDFHTLDKQKLFALNFSATQELDRQQQADKAEIAELKTKNTELENKVATLESELAAIKQHLGI